MWNRRMEGRRLAGRALAREERVWKNIFWRAYCTGW